MSTELLVIEKLELVPFFTKGDLLDDTLEKIKAEAMAHVPDVSTLKGRNAIKANVTKVTKSKTFLEGHGKDLAAEYKLIPKAIDANRKKSRDFLTALVDEIREPLTAWEVIDKAEKAQVIDTKAFLIEYELQHEDGLRDNELADLKAAQAEADRKAEIERAEIKAAAEAKAKAEQVAADKIKQAELDKAAAEQSEIKARQDAIDAKAAAKKSELDRAAAEAARKEEIRIDYHRRMIKHIIDCGNGFIGGSPQPFGILFRELETKIIINEGFEEFQQEAEHEKNKAIQKLNDLQKKQENDRVESEAKAKRDSEQAAETARLSEVYRQEQEAERQRREQAAREADLDNRASKNNAAKNAIIALGFNEEGAKAIVKAIANRAIPNVQINY